MKNLQILFCIAFLIFTTRPVNAQDDSKRHSIGIQLNPYLDSHFFTGTFFKPVFAVRYAFRAGNQFSFGPEVSGYFVKWNSNQGDLNISDIKLGGFARYNFLKSSRINPFIELSPYYSFHHFKSTTIVVQEGTGIDKYVSYFSGYLGPGISLFSKNQRFSLDLMYKFSDRTFVNEKKSVFSYRFNFHF